ncbi:head-tail connector protein [Salinispora arenicola]|uniref:head-tail connector protein n=1 Tax=Salinispora arenicola TaxID=168697 RepID=UPI000368191C|nr:head-tail connector protein [Salinispora arenicola]
MNYVDLVMLKNYLGVTTTSTDGLLNQAIHTASRWIDRHCGRRFHTDAGTTRVAVVPLRHRVIGDPHPGQSQLLVDDIATTTGLTVELGRAPSTWSSYTSWYADDPKPGWPVTVLRGTWSGTHTRITAVWGWPAVPDEVTQAALLQAARLHQRRSSPEGIAGSADWGSMRVTRIDPDVHALLSPFVLPAFA